MTELLKEDAQYRNDLLNAKSAADITAASERLLARQMGIQRDDASGQLRAQDGKFVAERQDDTGGRTYQQTIDVNGTQVTLEGTSPENLAYNVDIAKQAAAALTAAAAAPQKTQEELEAEAEEQRVGRAAALANLELQFKRGSIDAATYLRESGAVADWLAEQGVDIERLREDSQNKNEAAYTQEWAEATAKFLANSDWPGGEKNKNALHTTLTAMDLLDVDGVDGKLDALNQAYAYMCKQGTIFGHAETEADALDTLAKTRFGKTVAECSPQEILELWKQQNEGVAMGDATKANETFIEAFRRRG